MAAAAAVGGAMPIHQIDSWFTDALNEMNRRNSGGFQTGKTREPPKRFGREAVLHYNKLVSDGVSPSIPTSISALRACSGLKDLSNGVRIHRHLLHRNEHMNLYVATALMDMYSSCGSISEARKVFDALPARNGVAWNVLISGCSDCGEARFALKLFLEMQRESKPDGRSFVAALRACSALALQEDKSQVGESFVKIKCLETGMAIHAQAWSSGFGDNIYVRNTLVDMYGKCCSIQDARRVFESNPSVCVISWNTLMMGYAEVGQPDEALKLFTRMQEEGFTPDARSYVAALRAVSVSADNEKAGKVPDDEMERGFKLQQLEKGMALHSQVSRKRWDGNVFIGSSLVEMYGKCGSLEDSVRVFNRMRDRDVVTWTNLILAFVDNGEPEIALEAFRRSKMEARIQPDAGAYIAALRACAVLGALEAGRMIHRAFEHQPFAGTTIVATCLVDFYCKCGSMGEARGVFESIRKPDLVAWNTLLAGYADHGDCEHALELFERMKATSIRADGVSYLLVLSACGHAGKLDKGRECFESMPRGLREPEHYSCMVDLLGRANEIDEAVELLRGMPVEPNKSIWTALLTACQKWGNVEVGRVAFEALLRLDQRGSPAYLLMANSCELSASDW